MNTNKNIPFFDYPYLFKSEENELLEIITNVARRGAFIAQKELDDFEKNLASYLNVGFAVGVGNATDGLELALRAGSIEQDDEVIICSHTMLATAVAVHFAGAIAVPIDSGVNHLMDPDKIESAITGKTKAIFPTQINGCTAEMDAILFIAEKHNLLVFEDAAQALGAKMNGQYAGTFGAASAISFYPAKVMGCLGDGGAVITDDAAIYDKLVMLRDFGRNTNGDVGMWGRNTRLDNIQAAILDYRLGNYKDVIKRRREIAGIYNERLSHVKKLVLPRPPGDKKYFDVYQNYEIEADNRDELKQYLEKNGVGTLIQWDGIAIHQYKQLGFTQNLPFTDKLFERLLMLPMNMNITNEELDYVCGIIESFYSKIK